MSSNMKLYVNCMSKIKKQDQGKFKNEYFSFLNKSLDNPSLSLVIWKVAFAGLLICR